MKQLLAPGGSILLDSSDLRFLFEEEDGSFLIDLNDGYYGEVDFQMQYKQVKGETFDWLYIDFHTLSLYAANNGFRAELVQEGGYYIIWHSLPSYKLYPTIEELGREKFLHFPDYPH